MPFVTLIKTFKKEGEWVNYQIDSFNRFIDFGLQKIIDEIGSVRIVHEAEDLKLKFGKIEVGKPVVKEADGSVRTLYPNEARIRNITYMAPMYVTLTPIFNGVQERPEQVHIGDLPIMVRSKVCNLYGLNEEQMYEVGEDPTDPGGYFIVNGTERVLVLIEEIASNKPIFERDGDSITVRINSERSGFRQRHLIEMKQDGEMQI